MRRERISICLALLMAACTSSHDVPAPDGLDSPLTAAENITLSAKCQKEVDGSQDGMPNDLECIGLFSDVPNRTLYAGVEPYKPAVELWSDGAEKLRWIWLPKNTTIDSSDPGEWQFPVGTRLFKEFAYNDDGGPGAVETRLFVKVRSDYWTFTTYIWDADHKGALREDSGRDIDVGPIGMHHVPTNRECGQCHAGRRDRILGFEAISLGQEGATGQTLGALIDENLLTDPPPQVDMVVGDDGTGMGAPVIAWLHINCGVPCHNDNQDAQAYSTDLRMKLDPTMLDGRSSADFSAEKSTVGVKAKSLQWSSQVRITAGDPANSLLYKLISMRGGGKNNQMPPIASLRVDQPDVDTIADWIRALPLTAAADTTNN
jgi:hypothetical protein